MNEADLDRLKAMNEADTALAAALQEQARTAIGEAASNRFEYQGRVGTLKKAKPVSDAPNIRRSIMLVRYDGLTFVGDYSHIINWIDSLEIIIYNHD